VHFLIICKLRFPKKLVHGPIETLSGAKDRRLLRCVTQAGQFDTHEAPKFALSGCRFLTTTATSSGPRTREASRQTEYVISKKERGYRGFLPSPVPCSSSRIRSSGLSNSCNRCRCLVFTTSSAAETASSRDKAFAPGWEADNVHRDFFLGSAAGWTCRSADGQLGSLPRVWNDGFQRDATQVLCR
jgi:hypothetical protein